MSTITSKKQEQELMDFASIANTLQNSTVTSLRQEISLNFVSPSQWDLLATEFEDIIPEQTGSFNSGHWGDEMAEFMVFRQNSKLIGGAAVIVRKIPYSTTGVALLKWGPICKRFGEPFNAELYCKIIEAIKAEYCNKRSLYLTVMPPAKPIIDEYFKALLLHLGFRKGEGFPAPERYLVNVQEPADSLMTSLDQKWRYNLRKALKNDFKIEIAEEKIGLNTFLDLYKKMMDRKQFHDSSAINALANIMENSPPELRPIIVLVSHDDQVTAGGVFHTAGDVASYMFGATDSRALKLKAGYALHWWVAEYLCERKRIKWYDLGGNDLDKGLHQFKKGFVGKSGHVLISPSRYHYASSPIAKLAGVVAFQGRDLIAAATRKLHSLKQSKK